MELKRNLWLPGFAVIVLLLISSCTKEDPASPLPLPPPPSMAGFWSGTVTQNSVLIPFTLNLLQEVTNCYGNGALGSVSIYVSGQNNYPQVSFICTVAGYQPFVFNGQFTSKNTLTGLSNGSGFVNAATVFTKN